MSVLMGIVVSTILAGVWGALGQSLPFAIYIFATSLGVALRRSVRASSVLAGCGTLAAVSLAWAAIWWLVQRFIFHR